MFRGVSNLIGFGLLALSGIAQAADFSAWGRVEQPSPRTPEAIGSYSSGCLSGAVRLPLVGNGYQVVRPKRNRYYGHPDLIYFLQSLGQRAAQSGARILIGDLSQPRGGPMGYSHRSHQSGLDADIWFRHIPLGRELTWQQSNNAASASTVNGKTGRLKRWLPLYRDLLKHTAESPQVERIFVNPVIKQALCRSEADTFWLRKLRAWWGHDAHFHVRLACPPGNSLCRNQNPPPPGSGCDKYLDQWVEDQKNPKKGKPKPPKPFVLPDYCSVVLHGNN